MHSFIEDILKENFEENVVSEIRKNDLINYINDKTTAFNKNSKARANYGALYAIYVLVEDYISKNFQMPDFNYGEYEGAQFQALINRVRSLPYGKRIQNHYLNNRVNSEFNKKYSESEDIIIRDQQLQRYWINDSLLNVDNIDISETVIQIIDKYISLRNSNFEAFREMIYKLKEDNDISEVLNFINENISETADARRFEIISFAILKNYYQGMEVWYGESEEDIKKINPQLFKAGRTNANDGGIDFILIPLGKIYQVTETLNFAKYFLDIDKLNKYPISFVVKTEKGESFVRESIIETAKETYPEEDIYNKYISSIDEIITIIELREYLKILDERKEVENVLNDIIKEAEVEFNYEIENQ